ncbi:MAG: histidine phosphatase family protein [Myxococcales bacterium]|nr:histidine phosphatase family protein [Myxococcales bacterium]
MALSLSVVRHAPTNAEGLCVGRHEVPTRLTAAECAEAIRVQLTRAPDVVHSSPVSRCAAPAGLLAASWKVPHRVDERLHELHLGAWQGRPWASIERDEPAAFARYMDRWLDEPPPGGERPRDLEQRVAAWYGSLHDGHHLLVAHAGVVRALTVQLEGLSWVDAMRAPVPHLVLQQLARRP